MSASGQARRRLRSLLAPGLATLVALAILITLGMWQLERRAWKLDLLQQIASRAYGPPAAIAPERDWAAWSAAASEFRRVRLEGTFLNDATVPLHGLAELRGAAAPGVYMFTPLRLADGAIVWINRGFVPTAVGDPRDPAHAAPADLVAVTGLLRSPESRAAFVPANDPARGEWFVRSTEEMSRARGLSRVAPFYVDADATLRPGGWPLGGQTRLTLKNDHLQYALTWFGLALTLLGVFGAFAWRRVGEAGASESASPVLPRGSLG